MAQSEKTKAFMSCEISQKGRIIIAVEKEYGKPFFEVVGDYAADGESVKATAQLLDYATDTALRGLLKRYDMRHLFKLDRCKTNGFIAARAAQTGKHYKGDHLKALQNNISIAHKKRLEKHGMVHNGIFDSIAAHARNAGINPRTVHYRIAAGMSLGEALTKKSFRRGCSKVATY